MVLLRRWIPSCVRRNSTHGIPSQLTPLTRGQPDSQQPRNLDILKRHKLLYWENSEEAKKYADITLVTMNMFWLYFKGHTSCFFFIRVVYHSVWHCMSNVSSLNIFPCLLWIRPNTKKCIVNNVFYECCPLPQGTQWQNETPRHKSNCNIVNRRYKRLPHFNTRSLEQLKREGKHT